MLAIPFFLVDVPPVLDYPNHLARFFVLAHPEDPVLSEMYAPNWRILPNLGIGLITPIRFPLLLEPHLTSAWITAIRLSPVARPTDEKHLSTPGRTAEQLSKRNFARHGSRAEWTMAATRGKLNLLLVGSALGYESRPQESPDRFRGRGFSFSPRRLLP